MYLSNQKTYSKKWITIFIIMWTLIFHYESVRYFYLEPLVGHQLPKLKFLFPPAGWIMFYNVGEGYGLAEVFGVKHRHLEFIDPHQIFETKAVLYDNIHRNVLSGVVSSYYRPEFCRFLKRKFPEFENFYVTAAYYPSVIKDPRNKMYQLKYICQ